MKNLVIVILSAISIGSIAYGYNQKSIVVICASENEALVKLAKEQELKAKEFQKMAEVAQQEAMVQRTICEEQLKAFKK